MGAVAPAALAANPSPETRVGAVAPQVLAGPAEVAAVVILVGQAAVTLSARPVTEKDRATLLGTTAVGVGTSDTLIPLHPNAQAGDLAVLAFGGVYSNSWVATSANWRALGTYSGGNYHAANYWTRITQADVDAGGWYAAIRNNRSSEVTVAFYRGASDLVRSYGGIGGQTGSGEPIAPSFTAARDGEVLILSGHTGSASAGTYPAGWTYLDGRGGWNRSQIARRNTRATAGEVVPATQYTNPGSQGASAGMVLVADNTPADDLADLYDAIVHSEVFSWSSALTVDLADDRLSGDLEVLVTSAWGGITGPPPASWAKVSTVASGQPVMDVYARRVDGVNIAETTVSVSDSSGVTSAAAHYLVLRGTAAPTFVTGTTTTGPQTFDPDDLIFGWYTSINDGVLSAWSGTTPGPSDWPVGFRGWMTLRGMAALLTPDTASFSADVQTINGPGNGNVLTVMRTALSVGTLVPVGQAEVLPEALNMGLGVPTYAPETTTEAFPVTANVSVLLGQATTNPTGLPLTLRMTLGQAVTTTSAGRLVPTGGSGYATTQRSGGRVRSAIGVASWTPDVVPPPIEAPTPHVYVHAETYTAPTIGLHGRPTYDVERVTRRAHRDRIVIGGVDATYFRGVPTPFPGFSLVEPFVYGPTAITFPQIAAAFERPGTGALRFLRPWAPVLLQRVDVDTGEVVATDYRGIVVGYSADGGSLTVQVGGDLTGRAAIMDRQVPLFPSRHDTGWFVARGVRQLGLDFAPVDGPETGVTSQATGGGSMLDYLSGLLAMSWNTEGTRWTVDVSANGRWRMRRKDTTTITGTAYCDDARTVASLDRDLTMEPNRIYMTGVEPDGQRVRFGAYPGLKQTQDTPDYPVAGGAPFGQGTVNADTITGDGITVLNARLRVTKYTDEALSGTYTAATRRGVEELQRDMGRTVIDGVMDPGTWDALWDLNVTGFSLAWSKILPAAERSAVRRWNRAASGAIIGKNPNYDPLAVKVDRTIDVGTGYTRGQMRRWARAELTDGTTDNYVGSIRFSTGALVSGVHTPGDPLAPEDLLRARDLRPGDNLSLPLFGGGITVHVSAIEVSADGVVTATVDTRARDAMEVWEVIARNREAARSPYRAWLQQHRSSTETKDSIGVWDEVGGLLGADVTVPANTWTVFPVVAGQEGTVRSLRLRTTPAAEYVIGIFGKRIYPNRLRSLIGNPLTSEGAARWGAESVRSRLDSGSVLLYVAGDNTYPLGYFPRVKDGTRFPLTGRWEDDAGFSYRVPSQSAPVLWVAVYADRATTIPGGRIMWNQLDAGA
ncbi:hypothetical protein Pam4_36 [Pseudanabaena phage Pam4]|nr:hypothetical protein Pam4_36 [Pseudanabaena phage Pam4]